MPKTDYSRRLALGLAGAGLLATPRPARALAPVEILSGAFPPLTGADPGRPGFVNAVALDLLRLVGMPARLTVLPWAEAQRRVLAEPGRLLTPPARTPEREGRFTWVVKVLDVTSIIVSRTAELDLEGARGVGRLAVVRGTAHASALRRSAFANIVELDDPAAMIRAVVEGEVDAVYGLTEDLRAAARRSGRAAELRFGPPITPVPVYIASGLDTGSLPLADLAAGFVALEQDGTIEAHYRTYYGADAPRG